MLLLILPSHQLKQIDLFTKSPVVALCLVVWLQHSPNVNVSLGKRERIEKVAGTHTDTQGLASFTHLICTDTIYWATQLQRALPQP